MQALDLNKYAVFGNIVVDGVDVAHTIEAEAALLKRRIEAARARRDFALVDRLGEDLANLPAEWPLAD